MYNSVGPLPAEFLCALMTARNNGSGKMQFLYEADSLDRKKIAELLQLREFSQVYAAADLIRMKSVGDTVHLRAIIEFSNICGRQCRYCGLNVNNAEIPRYRMTHDEIIAAAQKAVSAGYRTIVLQSGEDSFFTRERIGRIVEDIKAIKPPDGSGLKSVAITLSCGELDRTDYEYLRERGADRYLLKHETANAKLYDELHPCGTLKSRVACLRTLKQLGYETGSGFMIGLPGQTIESIADDLLLLKDIGCDMAGIGPFISNPKTELAGAPDGDPELARRAVAIARLLLPEANLPLTTSLSVLSEKDKNRANPFSFGANVVMKKVTPDEYKAAYEIYPAELGKTDVLNDRRQLEELIRSCGREPL